MLFVCLLCWGLVVTIPMAKLNWALITHPRPPASTSPHPRRHRAAVEGRGRGAESTTPSTLRCWARRGRESVGSIRAAGGRRHATCGGENRDGDRYGDSGLWDARRRRQRAIGEWRGARRRRRWRTRSLRGYLAHGRDRRCARRGLTARGRGGDRRAGTARWARMRGGSVTGVQPDGSDEAGVRGGRGETRTWAAAGKRRGVHWWGAGAGPRTSRRSSPQRRRGR
ncbi:hypothetical protein B0H15DRAFT_872868 [Mycena belliarum]|uniref:Uncharacterized protein n=1 Tax=Mycena belliarum TaxID=1033014 RepID=A0AAD6XFH5_9AGAR|nr:hypothetical protein B0H15DRAFT_872868 [Mycena belliae]